jgi:hypothetical protein
LGTWWEDKNKRILSSFGPCGNTQEPDGDTKIQTPHIPLTHFHKGKTLGPVVCMLSSLIDCMKVLILKTICHHFEFNPFLRAWVCIHAILYVICLKIIKKNKWWLWTNVVLIYSLGFTFHVSVNLFQKKNYMPTKCKCSN